VIFEVVRSALVAQGNESFGNTPFRCGLDFCLPRSLSRVSAGQADALRERLRSADNEAGFMHMSNGVFTHSPTPYGF